MNIPLVDLKAEYQSIKGEIDAAIAAVIHDTAFIKGPFVEKFEAAFAAYIGAKFCVGVGNGTDSLEIIFKALGIGAGDEVLVPANSFIASSEAISAVGARPVFVEHLPALYTIDPADIRKKITKKTKAVMAVHLYGLPCELDEIVAITKEFGLHLIEDCAQAHGATYKGRKVGTFGTAGSFSFFPGKNLGAYGDAGGIVTDDPALAELCRKIANHGRIGKYNHEMEGRNSRLDGLHAGILSAKLPHLPRWTGERRRVASRYSELLNGCAGVVLPSAPAHSEAVFHLFVIQVENRDAVQKALKAAGIDTGVHYPIPLPFLEAYKHLGHTQEEFPVAKAQMHKILSLPIYPLLSDEQVHYIAKELQSAVLKGS